jgi:hypothetical protein
MPLDPLVMGTVYELFVEQDPPVDLSAVPITFLLDGPNQQRITLRYLNGGTDGALEPDTFGVRFALSPEYTALHFAPGSWSVWMAAGVAETDQYPVGYALLQVNRPNLGPFPVAGV